MASRAARLWALFLAQSLAACRPADSLTRSPPMPKWDGLKPLPQHVVAPLLRALACIPRTRDARLILRKRTDGRPPGWDRENDHDVEFRGRKVGRIWKYD